MEQTNRGDYSSLTNRDSQNPATDNPGATLDKADAMHHYTRLNNDSQYEKFDDDYSKPCLELLSEHESYSSYTHLDEACKDGEFRSEYQSPNETSQSEEHQTDLNYTILDQTAKESDLQNGFQSTQAALHPQEQQTDSSYTCLHNNNKRSVFGGEYLTASNTLATHQKIQNSETLEHQYQKPDRLLQEEGVLVRQDQECVDKRRRLPKIPDECIYSELILENENTKTWPLRCPFRKKACLLLFVAILVSLNVVIMSVVLYTTIRSKDDTEINSQTTDANAHTTEASMHSADDSMNTTENSLLSAEQNGPGVDCADIKKRYPRSLSGVYQIVIYSNSSSFQVYCDMETNEGGWTVFQRRIDGSENFYRRWTDYAVGFGNPAKEFWLGNDRLSSLTLSQQYKLRVDLGDWEGNYKYADYSLFKVSNSTDKYRLSQLGTYTGNAGDSLSWHKGRQFTTSDQDNDPHSNSFSSSNCAVDWRGAWWYNDCHVSNLNGEYNNTASAKGVNWYHWRGYTYSLRFTEMKIRPVTF